MAKNQQLPPPPKGTCNVGLLTDGMVIIQFGEPIMYMTFTPEQAEQIGLAFIKNASHGESVQRVSPPGKTVPQPRRKM